MFDLSVNNFRSFQDQNFHFKRINILIGENSGGKSSLLKFLLALKQTMDDPLESNLKLKGDYTDLGNYNEVIYNKNSKLPLQFSFSEQFEYPQYFKETFLLEIDKVSAKKEDQIDEMLEEFSTQPTTITFELNNKLDEHSSIKTIIENDAVGTLEIVQQDDNSDEVFKYIKCKLKISFKKLNKEIDIYGFKEGFFTYIIGDLRERIKKEFKSEKKVDEIYHSVAFLLVFQNFISQKIDNIRFVNPIIGSNPQRFYFHEDKKSTYKLIDIEKFINVIGDKNLNKKEQDERIALLNKTIKNLGIAEELRITKHKDIPVLTLEIKTKGYWSNITDVGYGVSLQIPILFQALISENYSKNGHTLLIEQPEVHLHPNLQAKFIETLLSIGPKNSYFIETHSEHLIRKLQVLIKNKFNGIKSTDVSIYYFKREKGKFEISEHNILENGRMSNSFPDGFFDNSYNLVKELL